MDELQALTERIEKLESQLEAVLATGNVVAPGGVPAPVPSQGGAPSFSDLQTGNPNPASGMERVGNTWRPAGSFGTPEQVQRAAQQFAAQATPQQLASAPVAPAPQPQPLPSPPAKDHSGAGSQPLPVVTGGYRPDEAPDDQVHQRAAMRAEQRRERMREKGQTPHIDRFEDAYRSEAYGAAGIPEPSRLPPTPGTAGHQQQSGGFDAIGNFAETSASSMVLMNARLALAMQQIEELRRDLEMKGHQ